MTPDLRVCRAHGLHIFERDFAQAESEFFQVEREKPTLTKLYGFLAMMYTSAGRFDDALRSLAKGYKVDPLFPVLPAVEVSIHFFARAYDDAIACGRKSLELHPYILVGRCFYAQALEYSGRLDEALREYRTACTMLPGLIWLHVLEAACLSKAGRQSEAAQMLDEVEFARQTQYIDAYYLSLLYDALGMRDRAFEELARAIEENSITLCLLNVDPKMDKLREDPRFGLLHQRIFGPPWFSPSGLSRRLSAPA
jgi:tetratricopeptide (TPR) repeat protein